MRVVLRYRCPLSRAQNKPANRNLKDHLLVKSASPMRFTGTLKDNTGLGPGHYDEEMVFPTLDFPSDHGVVQSKLEKVA